MWGQQEGADFAVVQAGAYDLPRVADTGRSNQCPAAFIGNQRIQIQGLAVLPEYRSTAVGADDLAFAVECLGFAGTEVGLLTVLPHKRMETGRALLPDLFRSDHHTSIADSGRASPTERVRLSV